MSRSSEALPVAASDSIVLQGQFGAFGGAGLALVVADLASVSSFAIFEPVLWADGV